MVNKPKAKGTAAETAVVRYFRENGFPDAQRLALAGNADEGDVEVCRGVIVEVKAGAAAESASDAQVAAWLEETDRERRNRNATLGFLVRKRKAKGEQNVGAWHAHLSGYDFARLVTSQGWIDGSAPAVEVRVADVAAVLRANGFGAVQ